MKTKLLLVILLISFQLSGVALAQVAFEGRVFDNNHEPLSYATITIRNISDEALVAVTYSNLDGVFSVLVPEDIEYNNLKGEVSFIGFETFLISPLSKGYQKITLQPKAELLNELTIIAERKWLNVVPGGLEYNIRTLGLEDAGSALNVMGQLPRIIHEGKSLTVIGRGEPLIYINGRKSSFDELAFIDASEILSAKLLTEPGVKYSSETTAVLEITTRSKEDGFGGMLYGDLYVGEGMSSEQYGSFTYRRGVLDVFMILSNAINNSKLSQMIDVNLQKRTSFNQCGTMKLHDISQYAVLGVNYFFSPTQQAGIRYSLDLSPRWNVVSNTETSFQENGEYSKEYNQVDFKMDSKHHRINFYYLGEMSPIFTLRLDGDIVDFRDSRENLFDITKNSKNEYNSSSKTHSFLASGKLQNELLILGGEVNIGAEISYTKNRQDFSSTLSSLKSNRSRMNNSSLAGFISYSKGWEKWQVTGGFRYEYNAFDYYKDNIKVDEQSKVFHDFVPYFSLNYNGTLMANLVFSRTLRKPTYNQLNNSEQFNNSYWYEGGNQYLKIEKNNNLAINLSKWGVLLSARYTHTNDGIMFYTTYDNDRGVLHSSPVNVSSAQELQLYASYSKELWNIWEPSIEVSYSKPFVEYEGISYSNPSWMLSIKNKVSLSYDINLFLNGMWTSQGSRGLETSGSYSKIDIRANKYFLNKSLRVTFAIEDAFRKLGTWSGKYTNEFTLLSNPIPDSRKVVLSLSYFFNRKRHRYEGQSSSDEIDRL